MSATWRISGVILLAGCGGANAGQSDPQACAPVAATEAPMDVSLLAGEFVVRLVASSGAKRGATAEGRLDLTLQDSAHRHLELPDGSTSSTYTLPLAGTATVDFAAVGAVAPGDPASTDPESPGVLVIARPGQILLRVGSEANRRDVRRFDGAFTVLRVQQVTDQGFAGTWESGVDMDRFGGHFCANRATG
ncbi:MAG TPA: hypothetical protein VM094_03725 [Gemmatimonadales bacterium]|nr:hypothetical protein [Gemmatimonadales bacterium]